MAKQKQVGTTNPEVSVDLQVFLLNRSARPLCMSASVISSPPFPVLPEPLGPLAATWSATARLSLSFVVLSSFSSGVALSFALAFGVSFCLGAGLALAEALAAGLFFDVRLSPSTCFSFFLPSYVRLAFLVLCRFLVLLILFLLLVLLVLLVLLF